MVEVYTVECAGIITYGLAIIASLEAQLSQGAQHTGFLIDIVIVDEILEGALGKLLRQIAFREKRGEQRQGFRVCFEGGFGTDGVSQDHSQRLL